MKVTSSAPWTEEYAQVIDRPEISEHASARIPKLRKTTRTIQDAFGMAPWQAGGRAGEFLPAAHEMR